MAERVTLSVPVYFGDRPIGVAQKLADQGRLRFVYEDSWREDEGIWPLSLSLPLTQAVHADQRRVASRPVTNFLFGLLPDNEALIDRWAREFGVGRHDPLALLKEIGADCPGGVSFVAPAADGWEEPIDSQQLGREMRRLQESLPSSLEGDHGQFSLAGAQAKTALRQTGTGWAIPHGGLPSTHILKPAMTGLPDQAINEHFCLELARRIGLPAAESEVVQFDDVPVLVVKRFDRFGSGDNVLRLHQEDFCQALGVHPRQKYEAEGGPTLADMMRLLDRYSADPWADQTRLYRAVLFNLIIAGTDAHAKNFAIVYPPTAGSPRLAPLYDMNSMYPYATQRRDMRSSLRIAGHYKFHDITRAHLVQRINGARLRVRDMEAVCDELLNELPQAARRLASDIVEKGLRSDIPAAITDGIDAACGRWLRG